jgi:hypothetical protein
MIDQVHKPLAPTIIISAPNLAPHRQPSECSIIDQYLEPLAPVIITATHAHHPS